MIRALTFLTFALLLFSCCKHEQINDTFTNYDLDWFVYNPDSVVIYMDNFGNIDTLVVVNKYIRNVKPHSGIICKETYPIMGDITLQVDTNLLSIHLYKDSKSNSGLQKVATLFDLRSNLIPDGQYVIFSDSIFINNIWQRDVYTITADTISYPNWKCLRFYFNKSKGFLKFDLRNDIFVTRQ